VRVSLNKLFHIARYAAITAAFLFALIMLALRYWLLPNIEHYRAELGASISRAAGQRVEIIGGISADWYGLRPHLLLRDVQIYDQHGLPALYFRSLENTLSLRTLVAGELRLHSLTIDQINLAVRRSADGLIYFAGIPVNQPDKESGFADWLLRQENIVVRNATLLWQDDMRGAPPLVLTQVNMRVENAGDRHTFGISALPPSTLASPIDLRGEFKGTTLHDLTGWQGKLYARMEQTDIAQWHNWVTLPYAIATGNGGLQAWVDFEKGMLSGVTADVSLADVRMRLAPDLPEMELQKMSGRVGWQHNSAKPLVFLFGAKKRVVDEFSTHKLYVVLRDGIAVAPVSFHARVSPATGEQPMEVQAEVDELRLEPLVALARYLPLDMQQREKLAQLSPRGGFHDLSVSWKGDWNTPLEYAVKGQFFKLGLNAFETFPGFSGLSGNLDGNHKGGSLFITTQGMQLALPKVFRAPVEIDALTLQMTWKKLKEEWEFRFSNVSLANEDAAGIAYGTFHTVKGTPGFIDLTALFSRADGRKVGKYIPLVVGQGARDWLDTSFLAGSSSDARLRLKGNLADFPYVDNKNGLFQITAKITGGRLDYAKNWPTIDNIAGDLLFEGKRMVVTTHAGNIFATKLPKVRATIPDLLSFDERLDIEGEVNGPTAEFLKFIEQSPVTEMINGFTEGMQAAGNGKLDLKLHIPLRNTKKTTLAGIYQFINNRILVGEDIPPVEGASGKLQFTEAGVNIRSATAQILGGAATIDASTQADGVVRVAAQGKLTAAGLSKSNYVPYAKYLHGTAGWRGSLTLRKKLADFVVDSNLVGMSSDLPAPFNKKVAESVVLHVEKRILNPQQDTLALSYGQVVNAKLLRRSDGRQMQLDRGTVSFGDVAVLPSQPGLWLHGALRYLDLDDWRNVIAQGDSKPGLVLNGGTLSVATLDAFGQRFSDLKLSGSMQQDGLLVALNGKDIVGDVNFRSLPQGHSKLTARFKNLTIPTAAPAKTSKPSEAQNAGEAPAMDVIAENFQIRQRKLGKLELTASPFDRGWHIEKMRLTNPESSLQMDGYWQWIGQASTRVNLKLEVADLGKFMTRFDQPDSIKRGTAKLEGNVGWKGAPSDLDFASLTGNFSVEAHNGQFLKIEPGIGKLLGILSLQALPRRITLDFRDVFSEGFAFDDIAANVRIQKGVASSEDFRMIGPAAIVLMNGETDLAQETQRLKVLVTPALGEGVSVASALLGGPVVGLTALLLQKILKDPLGQIASYEYLVTGTWRDPTVAKVAKPNRPSASTE
jgi:uncharacterized protein (TIGR02099 family)